MEFTEFLCMMASKVINFFFVKLAPVLHESLQLKSQVFILISKIRTFTIFGLQKSHKLQKTQKLWKQHSLHLLLRSKSFFAALLLASAVLPHGFCSICGLPCGFCGFTSRFLQLWSKDSGGPFFGNQNEFLIKNNKIPG